MSPADTVPGRFVTRTAASADETRTPATTIAVFELGFDPTRVAEQLGHARPSFTLDTYVHLFREANHAEDIRQRMPSSQFGSLLADGGQ